MTSNEAFSVARLLMVALAAILLFLTGCGGEQRQPPEKPAEQTAQPPAEPKPAAPEPVKPEVAKPEPPKPKAAKAPSPKATSKVSLMSPSNMTEKAPETFMVDFDTTKGNIKIQVTRSWAPQGADRFYNLVKNGFYDGCRFFRIVPNFVVQFGMSGDPRVGSVWQSANIPDDPVTKTNRKGSLTFATSGPNSRTTQIFVNLKANAFLDQQGFAPFAQIVEGMEIVEGLYAGYGEDPDQDMIKQRGNGYLTSRFPNLDYIKQATVGP